MEKMTSENVREVMLRRCAYYDDQLSALKNLVLAAGFTVEEMAEKRREAIQSLAVELAMDFSAVTRVQLECIDTPYFKKMLEPFSWYLKDVRDSIRLYAMAEVRA